MITTSCHLLRRLPGTNFLELLELFPDDEDEDNNSSSSSIDGKKSNLRGCSSDDDGGSSSSSNSSSNSSSSRSSSNSNSSSSSSSSSMENSKYIILKDNIELRIATAFNSDVENYDTSASTSKNTIHTGDDNDCDDQLSHVNTHALHINNNNNDNDINYNNDVNNNNDINNDNDHNGIAVDRAMIITNKIKQAFAPILDASPYRIHINSINDDSNTTTAATAFAFNYHQTLDINHTGNNYHHHYHRAVTSNHKNHNRIDDDDVYFNDDDVHLNYVNNENDALIDDEDEDGIDGVDKIKNQHSMNSSRRSMTDVNNINTAPLSQSSPLLSTPSLPLSSLSAAAALYYVSDSMFTLIVDRVESKILQLLHDYQSSLSLSILSQLKQMVESLELFGTLDYTHFYHHHHHHIQQNDPHHNPDEQYRNHDHHHGCDDRSDGIMDSITVWNESTVRYLLRLPVFSIKFHSEVNSMYMKMMHDDIEDNFDAVVDNHSHYNLKSTDTSFNVS